MAFCLSWQGAGWGGNMAFLSAASKKLVWGQMRLTIGLGMPNSDSPELEEPLTFYIRTCWNEAGPSRFMPPRTASTKNLGRCFPGWQLRGMCYKIALVGRHSFRPTRNLQR